MPSTGIGASKRRLAVALAIGLLVELALAGAVGVAAAAEDRDDELPSRLTVPGPRFGDRFVYERMVVDDVEDAPEVKAEWGRAAEVQWVQGDRLPDGEATVRNVDRAHVHRYRIDVPSPPTHVYRHYDPSTGEVVASEFVQERELSQSGRYGFHPRGNRHVLYHDEDVRQPDRLSPVRPFCGVREPGFQGEALDLSEPVVLFEHACNLGFPSDPGLAGLRFEPVDTQRLGDRDTVVFRSTGRVEAYVWLSPTVPSPLVIAYPASEGGPAGGRGLEEIRDDDYHVVRMVGWQAGDGPPATGANPLSPKPLPPLRWTKRKPWGLNDSGVDHPFPASEAYRWARENVSEVGLYLDDRPEAYTEHVAYRQDRTSTRVEHHWDLHLTDGESRLKVSMTRVDPETGDITYEHEVELERDAAYKPLPPEPPSEIPDRLPTVASLLDRWRAYATPELTDGTPTWGLSVVDPSPDISLPTVAGLDRYEETRPRDASFFRERPVAVSAGAVHRNVSEDGEQRSASRLCVLESGRACGLSERFSDTTRTVAPDNRTANATLFRPAEGEIAAGTADIAGVRTGLWRLPGPAALAATGLVAVVVSALYYAAPALKGLPWLPFYNRLESSEVLEHPIRRSMTQLVRDRPGIHLNAICEALDLGQSTAQHHLRKLEEADVVTSRKSQGYLCYFAAGEVDRRVMEAMETLRSESARRILRIIADAPGVSGQEVAARTGLASSTVSYHVHRLRDAGLIHADRVEGGLDLRPSRLGDRVLTRMGAG